MTAHDFQLSCYLAERIQTGLERKKQEKNVGNQCSARDLLKELWSDKQECILQDFFKSEHSENTFSETEEGRMKMSLYQTDYTTQLQEGQL